MAWVAVIGMGYLASCVGERPEFGKARTAGDAAFSSDSGDMWRSPHSLSSDARAPDASKIFEEPRVEAGMLDAGTLQTPQQSPEGSNTNNNADASSAEEEAYDSGKITNETAREAGIGTRTAECDACLEKDSSVPPYCGDGIVSDGEACDVSATWCHECQVVPAIAAGGGHSCALLKSGGVKCWGSGTKGQVGDGLNSEQLTPSDVTGLSRGVAAIAAGGHHTCALLTNGGVKCWGLGENGQLGNNDTSNKSAPVDVIGLSSGVAAIAAGSQHTCALLINGAIKCWGAGLRGRLGNDNTTDQLAPVDVAALDGAASAVTAGAQHTCALLANSGVKCWGYNVAGQLGSGDAEDRTIPIDVLNPGGNVSSVAAGAYHTCAVLTGGRVRCWGDGERGALGNGEMSYTTRPVDVVDPGSSVAAIAAGGSHTCALLTNGGVKCWGFGQSGQLGNNGTENHSAPVNVTNLGSAVSTIAAGTYHTCALLENGGTKCWGNGENGRLGNNDTSDQLTPVDVIGLP